MMMMMMTMMMSCLSGTKETLFKLTNIERYRESAKNNEKVHEVFD